MVYVALLRGINVGGKTRVEMPRLKIVFESLGFTDVKTYINSGNVIFSGTAPDVATIEAAIEREFGFNVKVVLRDMAAVKSIVNALPVNWTNDTTMKCDVMFLWENYDSPDILKQLPDFNPEHEDVLYTSGAIIWRVDRSYQSKSKMTRMVGTELYQHLTIRNCNTVRKLYELMEAIAG